MSTLTKASPAGSHPPFPRVHGYELLRILGEGAAGTVYEARKPGERQALAIKILHPYLANDEQVRGRFMREAEILASLDGPTVCPVLALGETDDTALPYMVMPKLEGQKLTDLDKDSMSVSEAIRLVGEILGALETAHRAGVVHRDLKPDNVIVGQGHVTVVDFGMAKIVRGSHEGNSSSELTSNGMIFGTAEYMAPEQARGETADPRCDVYAAGAILYELLCGSVPHVAANAILTLVKITREDAPPLHTRTSRTDVSAELEACVMHALAKDRNDRYPSARAFRDALAALSQAPAHHDSYFDTDHDAGLTLPVSGSLRSATPASGTLPIPDAPPSRAVRSTRDVAVDQHERTLDARAFARKRDQETLPDLRNEAPKLAGPRVVVNRRAAASTQPLVQPRPPAPVLSTPPPWGSAGGTGNTPSYASRVPPSLASRTPERAQRTALLVWAIMAFLAILAGVYLALGSASN